MRTPLRLLLPAGLLIAGCSPRTPDPVVAKVGPFSITQAEFHQRLAEVAPEYQNYVLTPNGRKQFLEILVREKLMLSAAQADGVDKRRDYEDEVAKLKEEQRQRLKEFQEYLLIKLWRDQLQSSGVLKVSDDEVRSQYEAHPLEVQLAHILVADPDEGEVLLKTVKKGSSFGTLAKAKSLDQDTAQNGGKLKPLLYGEVLPELKDVAFRMKVGEVTGLIRSKFGYHILKKEGQRRVPFEAAKERIQKILEKEKLDAHLESLQSRYPVEVVDVQFR